MAAEAVDSEGTWSRCHVKEEKEGFRHVSFVGWGPKHDRWVTYNEFRQCHVSQGSTDQTRPKRVKVGRKVVKEQSVTTLHLRRDDMVDAVVEGEVRKVQVQEIDPMKGTVGVIEVENASKSVIYLPAGAFTGLPIVKKQKKKPIQKRKRSHVTSGSVSVDGSRGRSFPRVDYRSER
ncbi:uncharacterized protein [Amphiura filiformis]|uniref:uncharacterized protein n=1 Tax=Amphiura filiformis TaxID=82378 RepID=UPI003B2144B2